MIGVNADRIKKPLEMLKLNEEDIVDTDFSIDLLEKKIDHLNVWFNRNAWEKLNAKGMLPCLLPPIISHGLFI